MNKPQPKIGQYRGLNMRVIRKRICINDVYLEYVKNEYFTENELLLIHLCAYHYPYSVKQIFSFAYQLKHAYNKSLSKLKYFIELGEKYGYQLHAVGMKELRRL